jgi:hypothetical protein
VETQDGCTALLVAARTFPSPKLLEKLLEAQADVSVVTDDVGPCHFLMID